MKSKPFIKEEFMKHFPADLSENIKKYADNKALDYSRYIFTERKGKQQWGYCTYCHASFKTPGLKHNKSNAICPHCGSKCIVKASGMSRKYMIDSAYFEYYDKSIVNPEAIIARGVFAVRDYRGDYRKVDTQLKVIACYLFKPGFSGMMSSRAYYSMAGSFQSWDMSERASVHSCYSYFNYKYTTFSMSRESLRKAVKGTPFQYSTWEKYNDDDMVKFFSLYAAYPCIEYLTKLGCKEIVKDKLYDRRTYGCVNWNGKTLWSVLRISKKDLNELQALKVPIDSLLLRIFQLAKKDGSNFTAQEALAFRNKYECSWNSLQSILSLSQMRKADRYIQAQLEKGNKNAGCSYGIGTSGMVISTWRDYIADCKTLQWNLADESILFPKDLHKAHQNTIKQVKIKANEQLNGAFTQKAKELAKYTFEFNGLLIRPVKSPKELIAEGSALHHCVGTYAERHAKGQCAIFLIRKTDKPDKPYFTLELLRDRIIQTRGKNNCNPGKDVAEFLEAWTAEKLTKKKKDERIQITVPA